MPRANPKSKTGTKSGASAGKRTKSNGVMSFGDAEAWLDGRVNVERLRPSRVDPETFKLARMEALLKELGDPHKMIRSVHIAGSKGKGSVCEMVASVLGACGYGVGVFTSPHLVCLRERIRIGNEPIGEDDFGSVMSRCRAASEKIARKGGKKLGEATFFELITAAALVYFADKAVDLAVIETGLGGRLDSTNVIEPEVTAITSIQLEHTELLGSTLEAIAKEKAGIFKPGAVALTVPQDEGVIEVFRARAEEVGTELLVLGDDVDFTWRFEAAHQMGPHARVSVSTERSAFDHLPSPLAGEHQAPNCGLALAIVDQLRARGFETSERDVAIGLSQTPCNGRVQLLLERPRVLIDGAHTPESVGALIKALGSTVGFDSLVVIFGCALDKRVDEMLTEIDRGADKVIFTRSENNPRAAEPEELAKRYQSISDTMAQTSPSLKEAINTAARAVGRDDLICVTGSFYLAGEAKALIDDMKARKGLA